MTTLVGSGASPGAQTVKSSWQPACAAARPRGKCATGSVTGREDRNLAPTISGVPAAAKAGEGDRVEKSA